MEEGIQHRSERFVSNLSRRARRWVFPPGCGICDVPLSPARQMESPFLCEECESKLTPMGAGACRVCGQSYGDGASSSLVLATFRCSNCADRELEFDFAISAFRSSGEARELMHAYKYGKQIHLAQLWGALLQRVWEDPRLEEVRGWHLVPVPLHRKRFRERGFNQATEIAREFSRQAKCSLPLPITSCLRRRKHTVRQAQLDRKERLSNLSDVFSMRKRHRPFEDGFGILLVDDVMTTATTVSECARILRESDGGDRPIVAISVLRG